VRYVFIKDRVGAGEITIKHCPTNDMLADQFTKSVQGSQLRKLRSKIQGIPEDMNDALMGWDRPSLKPKTSSKLDTPSPHECVVTNKDRAGTIKDYAYGTSPPPGSKIENTPSADAGSTGRTLAKQCAAGRRSYADAATGENSYANAARRALKLPARSI
jgi:hypothetical protein